MDIYNYHRETGEFMGITQADPNPVVPGEYLIPAFATTIEPTPPLAGKVSVFRDGAWAEEEDHRGETWWNPDGSEAIIRRIGDPLAYGLLKEPPPKEPEPELGKLRFALIHDGVVVQTLDLVLGANWALAEGYSMKVDEKDEARIGYLFDPVNIRFIPPSDPVPEPTEGSA